MENKFKEIKLTIDKAETVQTIQDVIFDIAEEKITVTQQDNKEIIYAETSYLYQLEKYALRKLNELSDRRFLYLNLFSMEARRNLDKEVFSSIKKITLEKLENYN